MDDQNRRIPENNQPFTLSREAVEEFRQLFKEEFGQDISYEEAFKRANNLLNLYKAIYGQHHKKKGTKHKY